MKTFLKLVVAILFFCLIISVFSEDSDSDVTYNHYDTENYEVNNEYNTYTENENYQVNNEVNNYYDYNMEANTDDTAPYLVDPESNTYYDPETDRYITGPTYFPDDYTAQTQEPTAEELPGGVLAMDEWTRADLEDVILSLIMCEYGDGLSYAPLDPNYFWHAMTYYCVSICEDVFAVSADGNYAMYDSLSLETLSQRLFAHSRGLLEIPAGASHLVSTDGYGNYQMVIGEHGDVRVDLSDFYLVQDGSYAVYADLVTGGDGVIGQWVVTLWNINGQWCVSDIYQY